MKKIILVAITLLVNYSIAQTTIKTGPPIQKAPPFNCKPIEPLVIDFSQYKKSNVNTQKNCGTPSNNYIIEELKLNSPNNNVSNLSFYAHQIVSIKTKIFYIDTLTTESDNMWCYSYHPEYRVKKYRYSKYINGENSWEGIQNNKVTKFYISYVRIERTYKRYTPENGWELHVRHDNMILISDGKHHQLQSFNGQGKFGDFMFSNTTPLSCHCVPDNIQSIEDKIMTHIKTNYPKCWDKNKQYHSYGYLMEEVNGHDHFIKYL